ncbi:MAG TPA: helix-turn-helix domain-containing protein [Streptosporangiaceae bacterium]|nr:helix-turn-helix domain-containing protein [Streptosporangiaceae bacterium]
MRRATPGPAGHPMVARLASELQDDLGALTEQLVVMLRQADEAYPAVNIDDLRKSIGDNFASFLDDLANQRDPNAASPRTTARRRASQGVPLGSVLHAYRLGFHVIWGALADRALRKGPEWMEGLIRGSAVVWAWVDTSSEVVNAEYHDALVESARQDEQQRMLLLDALFEGRLGVWKLLGGTMSAIGLPERGRYLAVSAETTGAGTENMPGMGQYLRHAGVPSAWRLRADEQVGLVAVSRTRDVLAVKDLLAQVATGRVGLSPDYDDALETSRALGVAAVARRCLPPGSTGVATVDDDSVAAVVVGCAPEVLDRAVHQLLGQVAKIAPGERQVLLGTLQAWLECGGNTSAAARRLYCHRNTVRNRLRRLETLSGQSLADPNGLTGLAIAAQGVRLLGHDHTP